MRRSLLAGIGVAAVLIFAACTADQSSDRPLAPTEPLLAPGPQVCPGQLASNIAKQIGDLYAGTQESNLLAQFQAIKNACPNVPNGQLFALFDSTVSYSAPTSVFTTADSITKLWENIVLYVKNETNDWDPSVLMGDGVPGGLVDGGAGQLLPANIAGLSELETFDHRARLSFDATTTPNDPRFFTFQPSTLCAGITTLVVQDGCYNVKDYPHLSAPGYQTSSGQPSGTLTLCLHHPNDANGDQVTTGILHQVSSTYTELLPEATDDLSCAHTTATLGTWLERRGGPLGKAFAAAYNFLAPRTLFADDAGESGSIGLFSVVGGVQDVTIEDNFNDPENFNDGNDVPDAGDAWIIEAVSPGYIKQQAALGSLTDGVVVLSQAQGACKKCPVFRLLASRWESATDDDDGTYEVTWQALQNKPSVKEAPFYILDGTGTNAKVIAKLSLVQESNKNFIKYNDQIVRDPNNPNNNTNPVLWTQNQHQNFKITVRLTDNDQSTNDFRTSLSIDGTEYVTEAPFVNGGTNGAKSLKAIGFILTGIDGGIMVSDNWQVTRVKK